MIMAINSTKRSNIWKYIYIYIYTPKIDLPKYVKQILANIKGDVDKNTKVVKYTNTHLHQ